MTQLSNSVFSLFNSSGHSILSRSFGRPSSYTEKSDRGKRLETSELCHDKSHETSLILQAAGMAARQQNKRDLALF